MDVGSFSPGQEALSKSPATAHGLVGRSPASAEEGGLLFGDFLLAIQEKATRPPQEDETLLMLLNHSSLSENLPRKVMPGTSGPYSLLLIGSLNVQIGPESEQLQIICRSATLGGLIPATMAR